MNGQYSIGEYVLDNWRLERLIGEGCYGKVYEAVREDFGETYSAAIKIITIPRNRNEINSVLAKGADEESAAVYFRSIAEKVIEEFTFMPRLKGAANIVSYEDYAIIEHENQIGWDIIIRMELLTSLMEYTQHNQFGEADVIHLGIDLCCALEVCQKYNIIHRDIKPENIFMSEAGDFKLGDFENTVFFNDTKLGFRNHMAPEIYLGMPYGLSSDIYSLGIIMYRFLNNNRVPFLPDYPQQVTYRDKNQAMERRMGGETLPAPKNGSDELKRIVLKACAYDPKDRYNKPSEMRLELERLSSNRRNDPPIIRGHILYDMAPIGGVKPKYRYRCPICGRQVKQKNTLCDKCREKRKKGIITAAFSITGVILILLLLFVLHRNNDKVSEIANTPSTDLLIAEAMPSLIDSGSCSENATWELYEDGTLYIRGTGEITDYEWDINDKKTTQPWNKYISRIKNVIIEDGITKIGDYAFYNCVNLSDVTIPDSLTDIGGQVFYETPWLKAQKDKFVIVGDGILLKYNGMDSEVEIPKGIKSISNAFESCQHLTSVTIPNSVTSIGDYAFCDCKKLTSVMIPDGVKNIGSHAFSYCDSLTCVTIPNSVTRICSFAFAFCSNITSLTIPDSVTSVGSNAFSTCKKMISVTIPDSVTDIGENAFFNCSRLEDINYTGSKAQWDKIVFGRYAFSFIPRTVHYNYLGGYGPIPGSYNGNYHNNFEIFELSEPLWSCSQVDVCLKITEFTGNPFRTWFVYAQERGLWDESGKWVKIGSFVLDKEHKDDFQNFTVELSEPMTVVAFEINPDGGASSNKYEVYYTNPICK